MFSIIPHHTILIIHFDVNVKKIFKLGKKYPWGKPDKCPECKGRRLWSHGFVFRYFKDFSQGLWIKRYRCPDCNTVHTVRPALFWRRFQYSASTILSSISNKLSNNKWLKHISRQNQQYWFKGLIFQASRVKNNIKNLAIDIVNKLIRKKIIPASHSIQSEILRI